MRFALVAADATTTADPAPIELLLASGDRLRIAPGTDALTLRTVLNILREPIRDLRDLTRCRAMLARDKARWSSRIQKVLEDANIKLASVASDVLGASGRDMLSAIVRGEGDANVLAELARKRLRAKIPQLRTALTGCITEHHRFLLRQWLDMLEVVEGKIAEFDQKIEERIRPLAQAVEIWNTIPGIDRVAAWSLVAEIGADMEQFPSAEHLSSWAGVCPGNNESAGKQKSGRTRRGSVWLRRVLCESAWAASHCRKIAARSWCFSKGRCASSGLAGATARCWLHHGRNSSFRYWLACSSVVTPVTRIPFTSRSCATPNERSTRPLARVVRCTSSRRLATIFPRNASFRYSVKSMTWLCIATTGAKIACTSLIARACCVHCLPVGPMRSRQIICGDRGWPLPFSLGRSHSFARTAGRNEEVTDQRCVK